MRVTVYPGSPTYVYVTHDGLTEGDVDAALLELTWHIPAPCCVVVLPQHELWRESEPGSEGETG